MEWWTTRRGRGVYTRTTELPLTSRFYVVVVIVQAVILIGVNIAIAVLVDDCLSALVLTLASVTILFMSYFAIEAIRTDNRHQLAAYAVTSVVFLSTYVPPILGETDGPHMIHVQRLQVDDDVHQLLVVAFVCTCALQFISLVLAMLTYKITYCSGALTSVGMRTYKKVGTDPTLLACYFVYQRWCTMLKVDWLFQIQLVAFCFLGIPEFSWQWLVTVACQLPIACVWLPVGLLAARRESPVMMASLLAAAACQVPLYAAQLLTLPPPNGTVTTHNHTRHNHSHSHQLGSSFHSHELGSSSFWSDLAGLGFPSQMHGGWGGGVDADQSHGAPSLSAEVMSAGLLWRGANWDDGSDGPGAGTGGGDGHGGFQHYCTQRLRERTFPFGSAAVNLLYLLAILSRLLLLFAGLRTRANFGRGLLSRVHNARIDESLGSSACTGASEALISSSGLLGGIEEPQIDQEAYVPAGPLAAATQGQSTAGSREEGGALGGRMAHDEALLARVGSLAASEAASSDYSFAGGPAQRLTIGTGSMSTLGGGSLTATLSRSFSMPPQGEPRDT